MLAAPQQAALAARGPAKARAAALAVNTPYGARIVGAWGAALVGKGWQVRAGHAEAETRRLLNEGFEAMLSPLLVPLVRALVRDGEAFVHLRVSSDGQLRPKLLPADQIDPALSRDLGD